MEENQEVALEAKQKKPWYLSRWYWITCAAVFVVSVALLIWAGTWPESYYEDDGSLTLETETDFTTIAAMAINDYLAAPSTLEMDYSSCTWKAYDNDVFALAGKFSAENAFGVPLVSDFYVSFHYGGDYDNSTVMKVAIDSEVYYERSK